MEFAEKLRAEKERLEFTQDELAGALDVSPRTVAHWLAETRIPVEVTQEGVMARLAQCAK